VRGDYPDAVWIILWAPCGHRAPVEVFSSKDSRMSGHPDLTLGSIDRSRYMRGTIWHTMIADSCGALNMFVSVARIRSDAFWFSACVNAFTAITRVQIPSGTPIQNQRDTNGFAETSQAQKSTTFAALLTSFTDSNLRKMPALRSQLRVSVKLGLSGESVACVRALNQRSCFALLASVR
jgi:hypothetical protein